jgi:Leucine-rich repeat (LRR) protein
MTGVSVADIATFDPVSGRVIGLDLSRRAINVLTKDIGSLSMLSTFDVRNNRLRTLPMQIGYLRNLETCLLDNNEISELPYEAEYLTSIDSLSVTGNWLCGVQPQLVKWLDLHDGDWRTTQECPRTVAP